MPTTIAHLSDIHFGREDPRVVDALLAHLREHPTDFSIVSGDFTQRARPREFMAAIRFYDQLPGRHLAVPGNHDVPLHNVLARWFQPYSNFQTYVTNEMRPVIDDGQTCVVGVNTARRFGRRWRGWWKDGVMRDDDLAFACATFSTTASPTKILVAHHPMQVDHERFSGDVVRAGKAAMKRLASAGCDAILYGHIHVPHALLGVDDARVDDKAHCAGPSVLCVMAGTATSDRLRMQTPNSYNRITFDARTCTVDVMSFDGKTFVLRSSQTFERDAECGWLAAPTRPGVATTPGDSASPGVTTDQKKAAPTS